MKLATFERIYLVEAFFKMHPRRHRQYTFVQSRKLLRRTHRCIDTNRNRAGGKATLTTK
jgi:hypothetical protein